MIKNFFRFVFLIYLSSLISPDIYAQKIYMIGDSHVGSKIYPKKVEEMVKEKYPGAQLSYSYKNGLRFSSFESAPDNYKSIVTFKPDILVVNLGTNEAYTTGKFSASRLQKGLDSFYSGLIKRLPNVKVVFVTPYTNKIKIKDTYKVNNINREVSDVILEFVNQHPGTYAIDINRQIGTKFIDSPKLIRDNVHLTAEGYKILGTDVGEDLINIAPLWVEFTGSSNEKAE